MEFQTIKNRLINATKSIFNKSARMKGSTPIVIAFVNSKPPKKCKPSTPPANKTASPRIFATRVVKKELFLLVSAEVISAKIGLARR